MANVTITVPDDQVTRLNNAFASEFGWDQSLGLTKTQFTKQQVIRMIKQIVKNNEANTVAQTARNATELDVENNLTLS